MERRILEYLGGVRRIGLRGVAALHRTACEARRPLATLAHERTHALSTVCTACATAPSRTMATQPPSAVQCLIVPKLNSTTSDAGCPAYCRPANTSAQSCQMRGLSSWAATCMSGRPPPPRVVRACVLLSEAHSAPYVPRTRGLARPNACAARRGAVSRSHASAAPARAPTSVTAASSAATLGCKEAASTSTGTTKSP